MRALAVWDYVSNGMDVTQERQVQVNLASNEHFTTPNKYGYLWIPATPGVNGSGSGTFFFNGQAVQYGTITWNPYDCSNVNDYVGNPNYSPFSVLDCQHPALIFSTGLNVPMTVHSVDVWQASTANNFYAFAARPPFVAVPGPCDIALSAGTPCFAAYSTTRALLMSHSGPLYQVNRSDNAVMDIGVVSPGGLANAAAQDAFCAGQQCVIQTMYDQSSMGNHLVYGTGDLGTTALYSALNTDSGVNAAKLPIAMSGAASKVYGAYFDMSMGYRRPNSRTSAATTTFGIATGGEMPKTAYMVTSGTHYSSGCCFDFGNAQAVPIDDGNGSMQAVYFGSATNWGYGAGPGPWVMADLENGLFPGNVTYNPNNTPQSTNFVTAMIKGGTNGFAIKAGDANHGTLTTLYEGPRPAG